jgi:acyl-coenzyme A thioesterase PaaI-like protein
MSEPLTILRRDAAMPEGPAAVAMVLQPLLAQAVGAGAEPVSLTMDYGAPVAAGEPVKVEAWVDRATRTLVFAHARIVAGSGAMAASGSAVFRRESAPRAASGGEG